MRAVKRQYLSMVLKMDTNPTRVIIDSPGLGVPEQQHCVFLADFRLNVPGGERLGSGKFLPIRDHRQVSKCQG